jgi:hypothetical protein
MRGAGELSHRRRRKALQRAIERLPGDSRRAMLAGLEEDPIIAGAYSAGPAVCPALAAYRRGARTGYTEFAQAWDRFARGRGVRRARRDDLATLVELLRAGLPADQSANGNGNGNGRVPAVSVSGSGRNGHVRATTNGNGHRPGTAETASAPTEDARL